MSIHTEKFTAVSLALLLTFFAGCVSDGNEEAEQSDKALLEELKRDEQVFKQQEETDKTETTDNDNTTRHYRTVHAAFSAHDTNGDGYIDQHEFSQFQLDPEIVRIRNTIPELAESGPLLFVEIDENKDDQISLQEMITITQPLLVRP